MLCKLNLSEDVRYIGCANATYHHFVWMRYVVILCCAWRCFEVLSFGRGDVFGKELQIGFAQLGIRNVEQRIKDINLSVNIKETVVALSCKALIK